MAPAAEHRREHAGRRSSPVKSRRRSPERRRSPKRGSSPSKRQSSAKEKAPERDKSPKRARLRSPAGPGSSRSPSPRSKRLKRAQDEREPEKRKGGEHGKGSREERNKGAEKEFRDLEKNAVSRSPSPRSKRLLRAQADRSKEREHGRNSGHKLQDSHSERSTKEKYNGGSSRSSVRDRSLSPARRDRTASPEPHRRRRHTSPSPSRASRDGARQQASKSQSVERSRDDNADSIAKMKAAEESLEAKEKNKQQPSFELSGKLAEETNRVRGVTLLFNEPADARKPDVRWRLYVFKAGEVLNEPLYVHRQSCYLFGRERRVADIPTDHPSCSKQHAVIQYRLVEKEQPDGLLSKQIRPYLMDLGSTNGTYINDNRIEPQRYYELFEKDTIKFGNSSREYVILHENSAT